MFRCGKKTLNGFQHEFPGEHLQLLVPTCCPHWLLNIIIVTICFLEDGNGHDKSRNCKVSLETSQEIGLLVNVLLLRRLFCSQTFWPPKKPNMAY